ncbi:MAG: thioredoxin family protein [Bacteroidia bacterium]|nr:thioredoxin family protein [Bacteroidia bacterium]
MKTTYQQALAHSMSYAEYRDLVSTLLAAGRTTGPASSEALLHYTKLNVQRMNRLDKTVVLGEALQVAVQTLPEPYTWLVISEGWCGDAAQILPVLAAAAEASLGRIELRIVLRDQHLDLMDQHLTRGGRAIPKLLVLRTEDLALLATWGPKPQPAQEQFWAQKEAGISYELRSETLHRWYAQDKTLTLQAELTALMGQLHLESA